MKNRTPDILNSERLTAVREKHMNRLTDFFNGKYHLLPFGLAGIGVCIEVDLKKDIGQIQDETEALFDILADRAEEITNEKVFRPLSIEVSVYGVHFIDKLFNSAVSYTKDTNLYWAEGLEKDIGSLRMPDFDLNELWQKTLKAYDIILNCKVNLPLIGTPTLGSPVVGLFNLYKDRLLYAFYDNPDGVRHDLRILTDTLITIHRSLIAKIPAEQFQPVIVGGRCQPRGFGQMCGCTTQLISKEIYDEFILPLDKEILQVYPNGGMIHLCGTHTQHIPTWNKLKELRAVQLNDRASEDLEYYFNGLRDDQIIYFYPTAKMTLEKAIEITGGRRLVVIDNIEKITELQKCLCTEGV